MFNKIMVFLNVCVARFLIFLRYRITIKGLEAIKKNGPREKILFLPNHPAFIDPIIITSRLLGPFKVRPLADMDQIDRPVIASICKRINVLALPDLGKRGTGQVDTIRKIMTECVEAVQNGDNLLIYPSGHTMRQRYENVGGASAVDMIVRRNPDARIVLVRTTGLWGSAFSRASGEEPRVGRTMKRALRLILAHGIFFLPKRRVTIEFVEPDDFPRKGGRKVINRYLEMFYNADAPPNTYVPYAFWERGGVRTLPEPKLHHVQGDLSRVPTSMREMVWKYLTEVVGVTRGSDSADLSNDLGMDSLAKAGLIVWMHQEFGFAAADVDALRTVGDVMLAACGEGSDASARELKEVSSQWARDYPVQSCPDDIADLNICQAFIRKARDNANKLIVADQTSGEKSYRELILGIYALQPTIRSLKGDYIGIMMPASVGATLLYYATLFSGKIPVMVNWTTGSRNLGLTMDNLGVENIITAKALVDTLGGKGVDLSVIADRFVFVENMRAALPLGDKLRAAFKSKFTRWRDLENTKIHDTAVVLFTSGSESVPKAVPLTHSNILSNVHGTWGVYDHDPDHCIIGMLPPFHSFGLMVSIIYSIVTGMRVAYYPDPTDSAMLGRIVNAYGCTMLIGTPSFLYGIVRACKPQQLKTLRLVVTGAEACSEHIYEVVKRACPHTTIIEGYGITECSPIVACNRQWDAQPRTIGRMLDNMESMIVDPDTLETVEAGSRGMLIVRGPNVFPGYIKYDGPSPFVEVDGKSWYRTGDLVTADESGSMTFRGRLKRFIKMGGEMISLPAIEDALLETFADESIDGPALAVVPAGEEGGIELVLCCVNEITREQANAAIRASGLSGLHNIRRVHHIEEIPVLGTGKTDYRTLTSMMQQLDTE